MTAKATPTFDTLPLIERKFCEHYVTHANATAALWHAGYHEDDPDPVKRRHACALRGSNLLDEPHIRTALAELLGAAGITKGRLLAKLAAMMDADIADFSEYMDGTTLADLRAAGAPTTLIKSASKSTSKEGASYRLEIADQLAAITTIAKVMGHLQDKPLEVKIDFGQVMTEWEKAKRQEASE